MYRFPSKYSNVYQRVSIPCIVSGGASRGKAESATRKAASVSNPWGRPQDRTPWWWWSTCFLHKILFLSWFFECPTTCGLSVYQDIWRHIKTYQNISKPLQWAMLPSCQWPLPHRFQGWQGSRAMRGGIYTTAEPYSVVFLWSLIDWFKVFVPSMHIYIYLYLQRLQNLACLGRCHRAQWHCYVHHGTSSHCQKTHQKPKESNRIYIYIYIYNIHIYLCTFTWFNGSDNLMTKTIAPPLKQTWPLSAFSLSASCKKHKNLSSVCTSIVYCS